VDANLGFLARQLLLTELHGDSYDVPGGIEVATPRGNWLGLWDATAAGDIEKLLMAAQERAKAGGTTLTGAVLLSPHGAAAAWNDIADALYVYGLPEASGPESVMVLANPPHPKPRGLRFIPLEESPGAFAMADGAELTVTELCGPAWPDPQLTCEKLAVEVAWHDTQLVGMVGTYGTALAERIALLWIEPQWREREVAQALVEHVSHAAQSAGRVLVTAWAKKQGLLRFALHEAGFEEQVTARFFSS